MRESMRWAIGAFVGLSLVGCLQLTSGSDGGSAAAAAASGATTADGAPSSVSGTNCTEPAGGILLCEQITACPGVDVDPGVLPGCGFRLGAAAPIDLECVCSGVLCPIGVPESCPNAAALLQNQNVLQVCEQASEGLCLPTAAFVADGGNTGAASECNTVCESQCAGSPGCIQLCGC